METDHSLIIPFFYFAYALIRIVGLISSMQICESQIVIPGIRFFKWVGVAGVGLALGEQPTHLHQNSFCISAGNFSFAFFLVGENVKRPKFASDTRWSNG